MLLSQLVEQYLRERETCVEYAGQMRHRVAHFVAAAGDDELCNVSIDAINRWLLLVPGKPVTRKGYRQALLSLLNYAADIGLVTRLDARRVRRPKIAYACPQAYSVAQVRALVEAAGTLRGYYRWGANRTGYWRALIAAAYDSGLRRGDLLSLPREAVAETCVVTQRKTGGVVVTGFHPETIRLVLELPGERPLTWGYHLREFTREYHHLAEVAEVGGTFRWLRRTSGTLAGREHLGQRSTAVFYRHYFDARLQASPTLPPMLVESTTAGC